MNEVNKIKELEVEIQKLKEENKHLKEKYVNKKCYSNECTLLLNKETGKLTISPTNRKIGLLGNIALMYILEQNDMNPDKVMSITVEKGVIAPNDSSELFAYFLNCETMDLKNLNTSQVTDMRSTFSCCKSLTNLDVSKWDTKNVTYMSEMFLNCLSLTTLDVSNWDTRNIRHMYNMFYNCSKLKTVNFGNNCINLVQKIPEFSKDTLNDKPIKTYEPNFKNNKKAKEEESIKKVIFNATCVGSYVAELEIPSELTRDKTTILSYICDNISDWKIISEIKFLDDRNPYDTIIEEDILEVVD